MRYSIEFTGRALRDLKSLPASEQKRLGKKIDALASNPRPPGVKKLRGVENMYRVRSGDYRVIYSISDNDLLILLIRIGNRRDLY